MIDDRKPDIILHQTPPKDCVEERPLLFKKYNGTFEISQGGEHELSVDYESIPEIIKVLRTIQSDPHPRNK